ncbi:Ubiquitin carboxyl-terminal hydrolase 30 [Fasciola hepatica]|uniref:ubiquitinyl hydrolase 1 n=1 Tax=Fasciola hepatica TaxID=6192 RepID=A0A4E0RVJ3_FASHE|nr:Ubiquitin carboxyl-terminal hydrolase 30 [Fasciola hepatica]
MTRVHFGGYFMNAIRVFDRIHRETPILLLITGSLAAGVSVFALTGVIRVFKYVTAPENDLPMGLPNPQNICYLNAVLQAMSTNSTLVRFLRRSARLHPNKMLYCLICILKGLRCTNRYITVNNLDRVLRDIHQMLITELMKSKRWSLDDQQDAPELFSYFMDVACSQSLGCTASKATEGLCSVSQFLGSRFEHTVPRCFHRGFVNGKCRAYAFRSPLRTDVFQRHLLANQVTCTNCGYRSSPSLQAEACITLCLDPSVSISNNLQSTTKSPHIYESRCSSSAPSLYDYLSKEFGTSEKLSDFLCPECQKSEQRSSAATTNYCQQERWIAHLPSCLVIHIQRGEWMDRLLPTELAIPWTGVAKKRSDYLFFPSRLNMANFMLSAKNSRLSLQNSFGDRITQSCSLESHFRRHHSYTLRSVLVHQGESVHAGHYIAYRTWMKVDPSTQRKRYSFVHFLRSLLTPVSNFFRALPSDASVVSSHWVFTSDEQVFRVPSQEVQSSLAYLLFYEREPPHFRSSVTGSFSQRISTYDHGNLSVPHRSHNLNFRKTTEPALWGQSGVDGDVFTDSVGSVRYIDCDEANMQDSEDEEEEEEEEFEDSDVLSDFAEEEFTGSRADVIRSLALAATQM